jgi:hypothetical protein
MLSLRPLLEIETIIPMPNRIATARQEDRQPDGETDKIQPLSTLHSYRAE